MSRFEGRSVLVTGGDTGIGKGCAPHFLERGATVTIAGPDGEILEAAASDLRNDAGSGGGRVPGLRRRQARRVDGVDTWH